MRSRLPNLVLSISKNKSPYISVVILTLATFMSVLDMTVVNVSLPKMAADLSTTPTEIIWIITAYIVANAAVLPISGWLATYFGRKRYYLACVVGFTITSVLCALATNLESLILFRILQGLSAGGIAPSEQAIIADITPREKLGRTFAIYGAAVSLAPVLGPTLGGFITDTFSWHWIFLINLPIGLMSFFLTAAFVKESSGAERATAEFRRSGSKIDWLGVVLFVSGIATLELVLIEGPKEGWLDSSFISAVLVYSVLSLIIGVAWEYYRKKPAVDVTLFLDRSFAGSSILILTVSLVISGSSYLMPFFTQVLLGYSAMDAGMTGLPATLSTLIVIQIIGYLSDKIDIRKVIFAGLVLAAFAVSNFAGLNLNVGYTDIIWVRIYYAISLGFLAATINTAAYYNIPPEKNNNASAMLNLVRNVGASLGVAMTSTIIAVNTQVHVNNLGYNASVLNPNFTETIRRLTNSFQSYGLTALEATGAAYGTVWRETIRQATMNAILDAIYFYIVLHILVIPLVFLLRAKGRSLP